MNKLLPQPIVIIGGMGPQASLRFQQLLVEKSQKYHSGQGSEYPYIVHFSIPIDDFISDQSRETAAAEHLRQLNAVLSVLQPKLITLACNTAHRLVPRIELFESKAFLSMIETVAYRLATDGVTRVGLLASPTTMRTKLYEKELGQLGVNVIRPDRVQQVALESCIRSVIEGKNTTRASRRLTSVGQALLSRGAQVLLLGCTELPLIFKQATGIPTYDCLDIYAEAVVAKYYLHA